VLRFFDEVPGWSRELLSTCRPGEPGPARNENRLYTDYRGNKLEDVATPVSGVVIYVCPVPSMKKGDTAAYIGEIASAPESGHARE
jgi:hypothetical protein